MLTVREAAERAGRTPETIRRWVWSGRLAAIRQGNRLLVAGRDVDAITAGTSAAGEARLSLAAWLEIVADQRRTGGLPRPQRGSSAADLVVSDRRGRDAG